MTIIDKKLRMTKQRKAMLEEIKKSKAHPTADNIYDLVKKKIPGISLGTVYRNLEILSGEGLVRKLELAHTQRRYDGNIKNHYHVLCTECGRVDDLITMGDDNIEELLGVRSYYQITGHRLKFFGLCPDCKKK
ncbi:MAG TPA: transcriptional repressor [Actinobacteria bacterium]|nr:transcriptional repressor [Actinomycetota bacterium]